MEFKVGTQGNLGCGSSIEAEGYKIIIQVWVDALNYTTIKLLIN